MELKPITATPSQIMVEQLAASGVEYVFYNSGSREARFFDALQAHSDIHGILALHEGIVASMAGGYAQASLKPAVMVVHLGAGLAQCMGQFYNIWFSGLPVVVITFAGDTGSFADKIALDLSHNVGPTSIIEPMTKATWTVIQPEGLPQAIERALRVAMAPPMGPVHLAVYDYLLDDRQVTTNLIIGEPEPARLGEVAPADVDLVLELIGKAERPLLYVGDGVWKRQGEAAATALVEQFGLPVVAEFDEFRSVDRNHPLHLGRMAEVRDSYQPDLLVCVGVANKGQGRPTDFDAIAGAKTVAIGASADRFRNLPGLNHAILADERKFLEALLARGEAAVALRQVNERKQMATALADNIRQKRLVNLNRRSQPDPARIPPIALANAIDRALARRGGGQILVEQYAVPLDFMDSTHEPGTIKTFRAGGASEGWGVGATAGTKLGAPGETVIGLVGDGSFYYADSAIWSARLHSIPVLYVISNNRAYGVVASAFGGANGDMKQSGHYSGVVLEAVEPVQIAAGFGVEGRVVENEAELDAAMEAGLKVVEEEGRPYLLDVRLPLGIPDGGMEATPFRLSDGA